MAIENDPQLEKLSKYIVDQRNHLPDVKHWKTVGRQLTNLEELLSSLDEEKQQDVLDYVKKLVTALSKLPHKASDILAEILVEVTTPPPVDVRWNFGSEYSNTQISDQLNAAIAVLTTAYDQSRNSQENQNTRSNTDVSPISKVTSANPTTTTAIAEVQVDPIFLELQELGWYLDIEYVEKLKEQYPNLLSDFLQYVKDENHPNVTHFVHHLIALRQTIIFAIHQTLLRLFDLSLSDAEKNVLGQPLQNLIDIAGRFSPNAEVHQYSIREQLRVREQAYEGEELSDVAFPLEKREGDLQGLYFVLLEAETFWEGSPEFIRAISLKNLEKPLEKQEFDAWVTLWINSNSSQILNTDEARARILTIFSQVSPKDRSGIAFQFLKDHPPQTADQAIEIIEIALEPFSLDEQKKILAQSLKNHPPQTADQVIEIIEIALEPFSLDEQKKILAQSLKNHPPQTADQVIEIIEISLKSLSSDEQWQILTQSLKNLPPQTADPTIEIIEAALEPFSLDEQRKILFKLLKKKGLDILGMSLLLTTSNMSEREEGLKDNKQLESVRQLIVQSLDVLPEEETAKVVYWIHKKYQTLINRAKLENLKKRVERYQSFTQGDVEALKTIQEELKDGTLEEKEILWSHYRRLIREIKEIDIPDYARISIHEFTVPASKKSESCQLVSKTDSANGYTYYQAVWKENDRKNPRTVNICKIG